MFTRHSHSKPPQKLNTVSIHYILYVLEFFTFSLTIDFISMLGGTGSACIMFITWGAVLGQLSPLQLVVMIILEVPLALGTEWLAVKVLQVK